MLLKCNLFLFFLCSEVAYALESQSTLSMINEPDVTGKTPVDYAGEGQTPRYCYCSILWGRGLGGWEPPLEKIICNLEARIFI